MKVTIEGTTEEMLEVAKLLTIGRTSRHAFEVPKNTDTTRRDVGDIQARDNIPNRFREEGV